MDEPFFDRLARQLGTSHSRRHVLGVAGKGTAAGIGAALAAQPFGVSAFGRMPALVVQEEAAVVIADFAFDPSTVEVTAGDTITWTNQGQAPHTATADDGSFDSGRLDNGGTFSHTFTTPGTVAYHCEFHTEMVATVVVNEAATPVTTAPYTRPNLHSLDPNGPELQAFATGVQAMKNLPETDPSSWMYQANIHGTAIPPSSWLDLFYTCEHHTNFFWPWHRMQLYWFEQIVREQSGDPNWELPYWDYSDPAHQYLPEPFRDPNNPLHEPLRSRDMHTRDVNSPGISAPMFDYCDGLGLPEFGDWNPNPPIPGASPILETGVHNPIHGWVGGRNPDGLMSFQETSAQDPVFWLHHANMDRLWASWRVLTLNGASHEHPVDPAWGNTPYEFFDQTGVKISPPWLVMSVTDTMAPPLGYQYEALADNSWFMANCEPSIPIPGRDDESGIATPGATPAAALEVGANAPEGGIAVGLEAVEVPVPLELPEAGDSLVSLGAGTVVLTLEGVQDTGIPAVSVEVYINLPADQEPEYRTPYFAGVIGVFGPSPAVEGHHTGRGDIRVFDISQNIAALEASGEWTGELTVTLVPVDLDPASATEAGTGTPEALGGPWVTIESVSVSVR